MIKRVLTNQDEQIIRRASKLLSRAQFGKARKLLQLFGLSDHTNGLIIEQMRKKHPERKEEITPFQTKNWGRTENACPGRCLTRNYGI